MMFFEIFHIFNHELQKVTHAHWNKYPNKFNKSVVSTDVIDRKIIGSTLVTTRLISARIANLPSFFNKYGENNYIVETSVVDLKNNKFTLESENIFLKNIVTVTECVVYESFGDKTTMTQKFNISVNIFGKTFFEKLVSENIKENSIRGFNAMNFLLETTKN